MNSTSNELPLIGSKSLCSVCNSMFNDIPRQGQQKPHHETFKTLEASAREGCRICSQIHQSLLVKLESITSSYSETLFPSIMCKCWESSPGLYGLTFFVNFGPEVARYVGWSYGFIPLTKQRDLGFNIEVAENGSMRAVHRSYEIIEANTRSPTAYSLARSWLRNCLSTHSQCDQHTFAGAKHDFWLPPRLLDLSFSQPRLVLAGNGPKGYPCKSSSPKQYATLSHCWGPLPSFLTLTSTRLDEFVRDGIAEDSLPNNFRDAVQISRWMKIRYLWIDSLCIIQEGEGSAEDWQYHVNIMTNIYANSTLCIATAAASSAKESCFRERDPELVRPAVVNIPTSNTPSNIAPHPHLLYNTDLHYDGHRTSRLASRAWAFQERLLSPRILTIGSQQLFWECIETDDYNFCETFPFGMPFSCGKAGPLNLPSPIMSTGHNPEDVRIQMVLMSAWTQLIEAYCSCELSKPDEDKLAAFSGIALHMSTAFNDKDYLAGLFRHELPSALLWHVGYGVPPQHRPNPSPRVYRAPSWSWASTDAPAQRRIPILNELEALEADYEINGCLEESDIVHFASLSSFLVEPAEDGTPFGQLNYAEINLNAPLLDFAWNRDSEDSWENRPNFVGVSEENRDSILFDSLDDSNAAQEDVKFLPIIGYKSKITVMGIIVKRLRQYEEVNNRKRQDDIQRMRRQYYMRIGMVDIRTDPHLSEISRETSRQEITLV